MNDIARQLAARVHSEPSDIAAFEQLRAHHQQAADLGALAAQLETWGNDAGDPLRASAYYSLAADASEHGGEREQAKYLYQQAVHKSSANYQAAERLQALWTEDGEQGPLAEFLDAYVRILEEAQGPADYLADLYFSLGSIWAEHFQQPDAATACYVRAIELDPTHTQAAYAARTLAEEAGDASGAAQFYELEARAEEDLERKLQLCSRLAELRAEELSDLEGAVAALRLALSAAPGDLQIMHGLANYLLRRASERDDGDAARDLERAAELYFQIAQAVDDTQAVEYLQAALDAVPAHLAALQALEARADAAGLAESLPQHWLGFITTAPPGPESSQRRVSLARAYANAGQVEDAVYCLEEATGADAEALRDALQQGQPLPEPQVPAGATPAPSPEGDGGAETAARGQDARDQMETDRPAARRGGTDQALPPNDRKAARDTVRARHATGDPEVDPLARLRARLHEHVTARESDEAAKVCRQLLELEPTDPEAFNYLEGHYRKRREHGPLRELLVMTAREEGLPTETRAGRLKQAATLAETKLKDSQAAIEAWQLLLTVSAADGDSTRNLKRLLRKEKRWDELAGVMEAELLSLRDETERAELLQTLVSLHRDRRGEPRDAAEALLQLYELQPQRPGIRDELCKTLLETAQFEEAVPLLEAKLAEADGERDRIALLAQLARIADEHQQDPERSYRLCEQVLALRGDDADALRRMEQLDERTGNFDRLLDTLELRAKHTPRGDRTALMMRMGRIAQAELSDIERAAEYYGNALDADPANTEALAVLTGMYEEAGRFDDLVELLRERTVLEKEESARAELLRRTAEVLAHHLHDEAGSVACYRQVLAVDAGDTDALRAVIAEAERQDDSALQAELLPRLAALVEDAAEKRTLLFDLAQLHRDALDQPAEAIAALRQIVEVVDPGFEPAAADLVELCERVEDHAGLAAALEPMLQGAENDAEVIPAARRLADLYEGPLPDAAKAIRALRRWRAADDGNTEPLRRLAALFEGADDHAALLGVLDGLAGLEGDEEQRTDATLRAAEIACEQLDDLEGAWARLVPLVKAGLRDAEEHLREYCRRGGRADRLANLHVGMAQEATEAAEQARHWAAATAILRDDVDNPQQALEAGLRMLAADLDNRDYLAQVDALARTLGAWPRLAQVYDRLIRQTQAADEKVLLLSRHADALEGPMPSEALDRILRCCALAPGDDTLLARAETLSARTDRSEELLLVYDRRRANADAPAERIEYLVRAARLCDRGLSDRPRASAYLKQALALTAEGEDLAAPILAAAREFDEARPELGPDDARRNLARAHRELAERADDSFAGPLILQAARLLRDELDDERAAFDMLRQGVSLVPRDEAVYEALRAAAQAGARLEALDAHLARAVDDAIEADVTVLLLERRAALLEGPLKRASEAIQVYNKLIQLRPDDADLAATLRASLRKEGRFQDLQVAIGKRLKRTDDEAEQAELLREAARIWDGELSNQWEALEAWQKVAQRLPQDQEASTAIARLQARTSVPPPDPFGAEQDTEQQATEQQATEQQDAEQRDAELQDAEQQQNDAPAEVDAEDSEAAEGPSAEDVDAGGTGAEAEAPASDTPPEDANEVDAHAVAGDEPPDEAGTPGPDDSDTDAEARVSPEVDDEDLWDDADDDADDARPSDDGENLSDRLAAAPEVAQTVDDADDEIEDDDIEDDGIEDDGLANLEAETGPVTLADLDADLSQGPGVGGIDLLAEDLESDIDYVEPPRQAQPSIPPPLPKPQVRTPSAPPAPGGTGRTAAAPVSGASIPPPLPPKRPDSTPAVRRAASIPPPLPPRKS